MACGSQYTLIVSEVNKVYATGNNIHGQLGLGNKRSSLAFQRVNFPSDITIKKVAAGTHSAALTEYGELYLWGTGTFGEFLQPQKVSGLNNAVLDVSVGRTFGSLVDMSGVVYSWGLNKSGELGLGDYETRFVPTQVGSLQGKRVTAICCGGSFAIALGVTVVHRNDTENGTKRASTTVGQSRRGSMGSIETESTVREQGGYRKSDAFSEYDPVRAEMNRGSIRAVTENVYTTLNTIGNEGRGTMTMNTMADEFYKKRPERSASPYEGPIREQRDQFRNETREKETNRTKSQTTKITEIYRADDSPPKYAKFERRSVQEVPDKNFSGITFEPSVHTASKVQQNRSNYFNLESGSKQIYIEDSNCYRKSVGTEPVSDSANFNTIDLDGSRKISISRTIDSQADMPPKRPETKRAQSISANYNTADKNTHSHTHSNSLHTHTNLHNNNLHNYYSNGEEVTVKRESIKPRNSKTEVQAEETDRVMKENESLKTEIGTMRDRVSELEEKLRFKERVEEVSYHDKALQRKNEKLENMYAELDLKHKELERAWQNEKENGVNMKKLLDEEKGQSKRFIKALEDNHSFMKTLEEENKELREKIKIVSENDDCQKERDYYKRKYEETQKKYEKKIEEMATDLKEREKQLEKLRDDQNAASQAIDELNNALTQLSKNEQKDKDVILKFENERNDLLEMNRQLRSDNFELSKGIERFNTQKEQHKNHHEEKMRAYNQM